VSIPVTLEIGGKPVTIAVAPVKSPDRHSPPGIATSYTSDWVDRSAATQPMWLRSPAKPYWFHYDAKSGAFYLQYNSCASDPSDPMPKFAARLEQVLAKRKPRRVIVDLRLNPGGEGYWNRY